MNTKLFVSLAVAFLLVALLSIGMNTAQAANPGPLAAPTPVSVSAQTTPGEAVLFSAKVLTADAGSASTLVKTFQRTDIQYVFDQTDVAGAPNTTTVKLQFSNDGVNWEDGATIANANVADGAALTQQAVFGKFMRVYADITSANPVTLTVIGVMK